ncbi:carbohydrate-binding module family 50 protein, partial [Periconia macrospinosa]
FSSTCVSVLNSNVTCDSSIEWAGAKHRYEDDQTLKNLCTATCTKSLSDWLRRVSGACTTRFITSNGDAILPAYWVERVVERYSVTCQQNGNEFCNAVLREEIGVNPEDQKVTKSPIPSSVTCNDCFLKQIQTQLQMPLSSNPDLASTFTSLTNQCSKTGFVVTPPATTTQFITKGTPPTTSGIPPSPTGCVGSIYSLKSTDTCQSVSLEQGLSTADLLTANGLQAYCEQFPTAGNLCIPTNAKCKTYTIKSGDSCVSIADANKLTFVQFVTWNPMVGQTCSLIGNFTGWTTCVSNPGGSWTNPSPSSSTESPTSSPTKV